MRWKPKSCFFLWEKKLKKHKYRKKFEKGIRIKLEGKYNVLRPSGKLVARFKIKNLFSLRGKKQAVIGNLKIEKMNDQKINEAKIINRQMKLIENGENLSLIKEDEFLANFDFTKNSLEIYEDEKLCVAIFFALINLEENKK